MKGVLKMALNTVERIVGRHGIRIIGQAEEQILKLEEHGHRGQRFVKQAKELIEGPLVKYLCSPQGKSLETICLIIPPECLHPKRAMKMIGSGRPLMSHGFDSVINKTSVPKTPYIICDVQLEKVANLEIGKRYLTLAEIMSWCVMNSPEPETALFSLSSKLDKQYVGIEFDHQRNPQITSWIKPLAKISIFTLSCAIGFIS